MNMLKELESFFATLSQKDFKKGITIGLSILGVICAGLLYRHYSAISSIKKDINVINSRRSNEIQALLTRYELVKKQKAEVEAVLAKDPSFKIIEFVDSIMNKLQMTRYKTKAELSQQELENGYTENQLYISLANVNIQQVAQFLYALEENERVYTKDVELYKSEAGGTINANISIGTLQPGTTRTDQETES